MTDQSGASGLAALLIVAVALALLSRPPDHHRKDSPVSYADDRPYTDPAGDPNRPEPLEDAARDTAKLTGAVSGIVGALVGAGTVSAATGSLLVGLFGLLLGLVSYVAAWIAAWRTAERSRPEVTPVSDPMKVVNGVLTELVPARHRRRDRDTVSTDDSDESS